MQRGGVEAAQSDDAAPGFPNIRPKCPQTPLEWRRTHAARWAA